MFVIALRKLIYQGAIDYKPTSDQAARHYVTDALTAAMQGKPSRSPPRPQRLLRQIRRVAAHLHPSPT